MRKGPAVNIRIEMLDLDGDVVAVSTRFYRDAPQCDAAWHRANVALTEPPRTGRRLPKRSARQTPAPQPTTEGDTD